MCAILTAKELEVSALHSRVKGLQGTVQGADGRIALLQYQLQKAKSATATAGAATAIAATADADAAADAVAKNVPENVLQRSAELNHVPQGSTFASPDRQVLT